MIYHFNFNCISLPLSHTHNSFPRSSFFLAHSCFSFFPCGHAHTHTAICPPHPLLTGRSLHALLQSAECHQFPPESAGVEGSQRLARGSQPHVTQREKLLHFESMWQAAKGGLKKREATFWLWVDH